MIQTNKPIKHPPQRRIQLGGPAIPNTPNTPPMIVGLDCIATRPNDFAAGTSHGDIWEVDETPRILIEGHEEDLDSVAPHPDFPNTFATACRSGMIRVWDTEKRDVVISAAIGFVAVGIAYSQEVYQSGSVPGWRGPGYHIAVGSANGRVAILSAEVSG